MNIKRIFSVGFAFFLFPSFCFGFAFEDIAQKTPNGFLTEEAKIFQNPNAIENRLYALEKTTGVEMAVVTIPNIPSDHTIETFAVELFEKWGIGKKKSDNGLLLLLSREEKKFRFEVGYGLEGSIPDILANRIIEAHMIPSFKEENYDQGVLHLIHSIQKILEGGDVQDILPASEASDPLPGWFIFTAIVWVVLMGFLKNPLKSGGLITGVPLAFLLAGIFGLIIYLFILLFSFLRSSSTDGVSGGWSSISGGGFSGGGSFGGFSGGMSGGAGVSGGW